MPSGCSACAAARRRRGDPRERTSAGRRSSAARPRRCSADRGDPPSLMYAPVPRARESDRRGVPGGPSGVRLGPRPGAPPQAGLPEHSTAPRVAHQPDPRRAAAGRQLPDEPGDIRDDVDGARGRPADRRGVRQEHDRQGRVPADGRDRAPLREHGRSSVSTPPTTGTPSARSTIGSSEAVMLGRHGAEVALAARRARPGKPTDRPNLVMGSNVQVVLGEVLPLLGRRGRATSRSRARPLRDQPGGGGRADRREHDRRGRHPRVDLRRRVTSRSRRSTTPRSTRRRPTGLDVPIHVDAASRRLRRAFLDPDLAWDFRLSSACSRSTRRATSTGSSTRARLGAVARPRGPARGPRLPRRLPRRRHADLLAEFLAARAQVVGQYYNFLRLGHAGYRAVTAGVPRHGRARLAERVGEVGPFELLSDGSALPVFAFRLRDDVEGYSVYDVCRAVRERGWIVPAYSMPRGLDDVHVLRVVVRNGFGRDLADSFVADLARAVERPGGCAAAASIRATARLSRLAMARRGSRRGARAAGGPSVRVVAADGGRARMLVDGLEAAVVDRADPTHLDFPYMRWIADVLDLGWRADAPLRAVHIGAGGYVLPRYLAATRPARTPRPTRATRRPRTRWAPCSTCAPSRAARARGRRARAAEPAPARSADVVVTDASRDPSSPPPDDRRVPARGAPRPARRRRAPDEPDRRAARGAPRAARRPPCSTPSPRSCSCAPRAVVAGRRTGNVVLGGRDRTLSLARLRARASRAEVPAAPDEVALLAEGAAILRDR